MAEKTGVTVAFVCMGERFTLEDLYTQRRALIEYSKNDERIGSTMVAHRAMDRRQVERLTEFQPDSLIIEVDDEHKAIEFVVYVHKVIRPVQITFVARYTDMLVELTSKLYPYARIYYMPYGLDNKPFSSDAILICDMHSSPSENVSATLN
jgi:hypothetical protein